MSDSKQTDASHPVHLSVRSLAANLAPVDSEWISPRDATGRVLADPLLADRDSPPANVSAMDGFAFKLSDVRSRSIPVCGIAAAGSPPQPVPAGQAIKIFTGGIVPAECDCVLRREDTLEQPNQVQLQVPLESLTVGQNIRYQGENLAQGDTVLATGTLLTSAAMAGVASFAPQRLCCHRQVRVSLLATGDELGQMGEAVQDWQIRDSNGPWLSSWLSGSNWLTITEQTRVADSLEQTQAALSHCLEVSDAVILTGGVSMGDTDFVPQAVENLGGRVIFHRLPIRPGKPVLGAICNGKLVLGLPGNPVSVAVTARIIAEPLLKYLSGNTAWCSDVRTLVEVDDPGQRTLDLYWYRLVTPPCDGRVQLVPSRGSGDVISLARSYGFVEVPPQAIGRGPWRLQVW